MSETTPLSLFLVASKLLYGLRLCIFWQGREEGKVSSTFLSREQKHPDMASAFSSLARMRSQSCPVWKGGWLDQSSHDPSLGGGHKIEVHSSRKKGDAQLQFCSSCILSCPLVSLASSLTVPNIHHAHLHLSAFTLFARNTFSPLLSACQILFLLVGSVHIPSTPSHIPVHIDFFLEQTLHSFIYSSIFSIYIHVVPIVSTIQLNI